MKTLSVGSIAEVEALEVAVARSANKAVAQLSQLHGGSEGLRALWAMKFQPMGCQPLDSEAPLNLIEQLNQTFTYLASARAARVLLSIHPELAPLTLNLGTSPGSDIESTLGPGLAAEVFAAVDTSNNKKLASDIAKVRQSAAGFKYVFFMCPGYPPGRQPALERDFEVVVWSVGGEL